MKGKEIKHVSCGCCSNGCTCHNHMDIPKGCPPKMCSYCEKLPFAPLDKTYRYDCTTGQYVRKPQGVPVTQ